MSHSMQSVGLLTASPSAFRTLRLRSSAARSFPGRLLSLACGVGLALAFDPVGWGLLAPLSLAIFFSRVWHLPRARVAALDGFVFGVAFLGTHLWWLVDSIGVVAWVALTLAESLWFALGFVGAYLCRRQVLWPVATAFIWTAFEIFRQSWPFGGLPWGQLGVAALDTPLEAALPYVGVTGTSLLVALVAAAGAHLVAGRSKAAWASAGVVGLVVLIALSTLGRTRAGADNHLSEEVGDGKVIALVQGGVPGDGRDVLDYRPEILSSSLELTRAIRGSLPANALGPDLVIWAEGAAGGSPADDDNVRAQITAAAREVGAPILVGSINAGPTAGTRYNQGVVWSAEGPKPLAYTKLHPVPFGEFIPARNLIGGLSSQFDRIPFDMVPGPSPEPMSAGGMVIANAICFDIAYSGAIRDQVVAGAELIVVQTSNATFAGTSQPQQQFAITRARAIETQRAVVVSSLNGVTGAIRPDGSVIEQLSPEAVAAAVVTVTPSRYLTPAVRLGPRLLEGILVGAGLALLAESVRRLREARGASRNRTQHRPARYPTGVP